jgi:hypothetical protein
MLLKEYQQISDIDQTIMALHKRLTELYDVRSEMFSKTAGLAAQKHFSTPIYTNTAWTTRANITTERSIYDMLAIFWSSYGVKLPSYKSLKTTLAKADDLCINLNLAAPDAKFEVIILPPAAVFNYANSPAVLDFSANVDAPRASSKTWKVYVVSGSEHGVDIDDYAAFINEGGMTLGNTFMQGLTVAEYATYASVTNNTIDKDSWSVIIRGINKKSRTVPCILRTTNSFTFDTDSIDVMIGENHFRPALEVK